MGEVELVEAGIVVVVLEGSVVTVVVAPVPSEPQPAATRPATSSAAETRPMGEECQLFITAPGWTPDRNCTDLWV